MNSDFIFENKNYISDRRACGIYGYSLVYLKELCDSAVIDHKVKDGALFVSEDAIKAHKLGLLSSRPKSGIKVDLKPLTGKLLPIKSHLDHTASKMVALSFALISFATLIVFLMKIVPVTVIGLEG
jgi:hypothetical protein